jgi:hypothetical protein
MVVQVNWDANDLEVFYGVVGNSERKPSRRTGGRTVQAQAGAARTLGYVSRELRKLLGYLRLGRYAVSFISSS